MVFECLNGGENDLARQVFTVLEFPILNQLQGGYCYPVIHFRKLDCFGHDRLWRRL